MLFIISFSSLSLLIFFASAIMLFKGERLFAEDPESLRRRVLVEVPVAYKQFQEYCVKLQGTVDLTDNTHKQAKGEKRKERRHYEVKMNKNCAYWLVQGMGDEFFGGELVVKNPFYTFQLKRKSLDADWYLTALDRKGNDSGLARMRPARGNVEETLLYGYKIYDLTLTDVLAETNDCKIQQIAAIRKDGIEVVPV